MHKEDIGANLTGISSGSLKLPTPTAIAAAACKHPYRIRSGILSRVGITCRTQICGRHHLLHSFFPSFIFRVILAVTVIRALQRAIKQLSAGRAKPGSSALCNCSRHKLEYISVNPISSRTGPCNLKGGTPRPGNCQPRWRPCYLRLHLLWNRSVSLDPQ